MGPGKRRLQSNSIKVHTRSKSVQFLACVQGEQGLSFTLSFILLSGASWRHPFRKKKFYLDLKAASTKAGTTSAQVRNLIHDIESLGGVSAVQQFSYSQSLGFIDKFL